MPRGGRSLGWRALPQEAGQFPVRACRSGGAGRIPGMPIRNRRCYLALFNGSRFREQEGPRRNALLQGPDPVVVPVCSPPPVCCCPWVLMGAGDAGCVVGIADGPGRERDAV